MIAQLEDYICNFLDRGAAGEFSRGHSQNSQIPTKWFQEEATRVRGVCSRLLAEGGADYDFAKVNPGTVWRVLLGESTGGAKVVPADETGAIVFGIYSHGDRHATGTATDAAADPTTNNEWYVHFPYPARGDPSIYDFVAHDSRNHHQHHLYATQLRLIFHQLFQRDPNRPVVGILNYCLSGGSLEFMRRPVVKSYYNADAWPLFLVSSSGSGKDSMVAGMWDAWWEELCGEISGSSGYSFPHLFRVAEIGYYQRNLYELSNAVKARVYVPNVWRLRFRWRQGEEVKEVDPWHADLERALQEALKETRLAVDGGSSANMLAAFDRTTLELQKAYESGEAFSVVKNIPEEAKLKLLRIGTGVAEVGADIVLWNSMATVTDARGAREVVRNLGAQPWPVKLVQYQMVRETGVCKSLSSVVRNAITAIAQPEQVHGEASEIITRSGVRDILRL